MQSLALHILCLASIFFKMWSFNWRHLCRYAIKCARVGIHLNKCTWLGNPILKPEKYILLKLVNFCEPSPTNMGLLALVARFQSVSASSHIWLWRNLKKYQHFTWFCEILMPPFWIECLCAPWPSVFYMSPMQKTNITSHNRPNSQREVLRNTKPNNHSLHCIHRLHIEVASLL